MGSAETKVTTLLPPSSLAFWRGSIVILVLVILVFGWFFNIFSTANGLKSSIRCHWSNVCPAVLRHIRRCHSTRQLDQFLQCLFLPDDIRRAATPRRSTNHGEIQWIDISKDLPHHHESGLPAHV